MTTQEESHIADIEITLVGVILALVLVFGPIICLFQSRDHYRAGAIPKGRAWLVAGILGFAVDVWLIAAFVSWFNHS